MDWHVARCDPFARRGGFVRHTSDEELLTLIRSSDVSWSRASNTGR